MDFTFVYYVFGLDPSLPWLHKAITVVPRTHLVLVTVIIWGVCHCEEEDDPALPTSGNARFRQIYQFFQGRIKSEAP